VAQSYRMGEFEVRPDERTLLRKGARMAMGARAFDLLLYLIEHRDRVVATHELLERVWPGAQARDNNLQVQVSALRKMLGPQAVATVPRSGYRFTMPVEVAGAEVVAPPVSGASRPRPAHDSPAMALPTKPSIAVLPFDNLSGAPDQDVFVDGVTEDVITELSRFRSLFVIARNSSFSYKGKAVDVRTIAKDLGVRYVVQGSMRRGPNRIRVSAQLVEAGSGQQIWAERYDRPAEDLFTVQEELTRDIVAAIAPQIEASEFQKLRGSRRGDLTAYELAMRAREMARWADRDAEAPSSDEALRLAQAALGLDPHCGIALDTIAYLRWRQLWARTATSEPQCLEAGLAAARHAIAVDSGDHVAHLWKGMLMTFAGQHESGLADLRRAHELNPNDALTLSLLGQCEAGAGDPHTGILHATEALRLSPRDSLRWSFLNSIAWAHFAAADYASAVALAQQSIDEAPRFFPPHLCLVVSRVGLGELAVAKSNLTRVRDMAPQQVDDRLGGRWPLADESLRLRATTLLRAAAGEAEVDSLQATSGTAPRQSRVYGGGAGKAG